MIQIKYNRIQKLPILIGVVFCVLLGVQSVWAEGSKDLYPAGALGGRGMLHFRHFSDVNSVPSFVPNPKGVHYVYAEEGEQIAIATDAQRSSNPRIFLYDPNGTQISLSFDGVKGHIPNRTAELAGPKLPNQASGGNYYEPIYYTVPRGGAGIYSVEFIGDERYNDVYIPFSKATEWPAASSIYFLVAWDISVAKNSGSTWNWVKGRVFTYSLSLFNSIVPNPPIPGTTGYPVTPQEGFYGQFKFLTRDGYVYNFNSNGHYGGTIYVSASNKGYGKEDNSEEPSYQSMKAINLGPVRIRYGFPDLVGTDFTKYCRVFYNLPDSNMPETAKGAPGGNDTWLRPKEKNATSMVTNTQVESIVGQQYAKNITFDNESTSTYKIVIKPKAGSASNFPQRILQGRSILGRNSVLWDGYDGARNLVPLNEAIVSVELNSNFGEIHVPFINGQLNPRGLILELLSTNLQTVVSDKIYWDDTTIFPGLVYTNGGRTYPENANHILFPNGTSSHVNGRIFGVNANRFEAAFGFNTALDTYTFAQRSTISEEVNAAQQIADLEVVAVTANKTLISNGENIVYTIKVKNNGPNDVQGATFTFQIPTGFTPIKTVFVSSTCGSESTAILYDAQKQRYTSKLNLINGCEIEYKITLRAANPFSTSTQIAVEGAILRPSNVNDPDATNQNNVPPTDAHYECDNNGLTRLCNNIKTNQTVVLSTEPLSFVKDGFLTNSNAGGLAQIGETITYKIKLVNNGGANLYSIVLIDPLLGGTITAIPQKSINADNVLDVGETWIYTLEYTLTQEDLNRGGVYNQAKVRFRETLSGVIINKNSQPTIPLTPTDVGYDPDRLNYTFVPFKVKSLLITNPMIRQRVKK